MAYFPDLTPCTYFLPAEPDPEDEDPAIPPLLAVGWLDASHPFPAGDPGREVFERLKVFQKMWWEPIAFLGGHPCELCRYDGFYSHKDLFIPGPGVSYAVPEGIVHYIAAHGYCPPQEFREAVLRSPLPDTPEFFAALQACGWPPALASLDDTRYMSNPRIVAFDRALQARGRAFASAVDAALVLSGQRPATLADADCLLDAVEWTYTSIADDNHYVIRGEATPEGLPLAYDSRFGRHWP